jgi:hypothetical protein
MSRRVRLVAAATAACLLIAVLVVSLRLGFGEISRNYQTWLGQIDDSAIELGRGDAPLPPRAGLQRIDAPKIVCPDASFAEQLEQQFASYDRIVVEIHRDGSLRVMGQAMPLAAFRSLLDDQQHEGVLTFVAIRPADDCVYRHVDHVVRLCNSMGIPHLVMSAAVSPATTQVPTTPG